MDRKTAGASVELNDELADKTKTTLAAPQDRRHQVYLVAAVVVWALGAFSTHWIGVWAGIGLAAVALGMWGLLLDDRLTADLRRPSPKQLGIGLLAGIFMLVVTYLGYASVMANIPELHGATGELYRFFVSLPPYLIPVAVPLIIVSEEIVWRGRVQGLFQQRTHPILAAVGAAAVYALAHAPIGSALLVGVAFACGLFWSVLRGATGSIVPGLIAHVIWDVFVMVLFPLTPPS
jgi:membrane protease YdiL (CAAX protease family)